METSFGRVTISEVGWQFWGEFLKLCFIYNLHIHDIHSLAIQIFYEKKERTDGS